MVSAPAPKQRARSAAEQVWNLGTRLLEDEAFLAKLAFPKGDTRPRIQLVLRVRDEYFMNEDLLDDLLKSAHKAGFGKRRRNMLREQVVAAFRVLEGSYNWHMAYPFEVWETVFANEADLRDRIRLDQEEIMSPWFHLGSLDQQLELITKSLKPWKEEASDQLTRAFLSPHGQQDASRAAQLVNAWTRVWGEKLEILGGRPVHRKEWYDSPHPKVVLESGNYWKTVQSALAKYLKRDYYCEVLRAFRRCDNAMPEAVDRLQTEPPPLKESLERIRAQLHQVLSEEVPVPDHYWAQVKFHPESTSVFRPVQDRNKPLDSKVMERWIVARKYLPSLFETCKQRRGPANQKLETLREALIPAISVWLGITHFGLAPSRPVSKDKMAERDGTVSEHIDSKEDHHSQSLRIVNVIPMTSNDRLVVALQVLTNQTDVGRFKDWYDEPPSITVALHHRGEPTRLERYERSQLDLEDIIGSEGAGKWLEIQDELQSRLRRAEELTNWALGQENPGEEAFGLIYLPVPPGGIRPVSTLNDLLAAGELIRGQREVAEASRQNRDEYEKEGAKGLAARGLAARRLFANHPANKSRINPAAEKAGEALVEGCLKWFHEEYLKVWGRGEELILFANSRLRCKCCAYAAVTASVYWVEAQEDLGAEEGDPNRPRRWHPEVQPYDLGDADDHGGHKVALEELIGRLAQVLQLR